MLNYFLLLKMHLQLKFTPALFFTVSRYRSTYADLLKQGKYFKNTTQYGKRTHEW